MSGVLQEAWCEMRSVSETEAAKKDIPKYGYVNIPLVLWSESLRAVFLW